MFPMSDVPMDGTQVLLHHKVHGWIEGWFSEGYWSEDTPISPREYSGDVWVLGDDLAQEEVEFWSNDEIYHGQIDGWLPVEQLSSVAQELDARRKRAKDLNESFYIMYKLGLPISPSRMKTIQPLIDADTKIKQLSTGSPAGTQWVLDV